MRGRPGRHHGDVHPEGRGRRGRLGGQDGKADLLAVDRYGKLWLYAGTGRAAAPFAPRVQVGTGWNIYNIVNGAGDLNQDGRPDLVARDGAGRLWLYTGTGNAAAPYKPRTLIGKGWSTYSNLV
ncbi:FG-GAP repeat domain-containing protein [Streptomyces wuyuanensis]|uniref:FG-GAP repeat domain-containing protein n=1 Tax=Streptomyces wuyuanensis TaxID=1196353 RepID=UPI0036A7A6F7